MFVRIGHIVETLDEDFEGDGSGQIDLHVVKGKTQTVRVLLFYARKGQRVLENLIRRKTC